MQERSASASGAISAIGSAARPNPNGHSRSSWARPPRNPIPSREWRRPPRHPGHLQTGANDRMHECRWQGVSPLRHGVPCSGTPRLSACCTASPPLPPLGLLAACGCHSRWLSTSPMSLTARPPQSLLPAALRNRRQRTTSFQEEVVRCRRFRSAGEDPDCGGRGRH